MITHLLESDTAGEGTEGESVMVLTSDVVVVLKEVMYVQAKK